MYELKAGVTAWIQNSKHKERVDLAKRKVQEYIKTKTGMTVDKPDPVGAGGTTTTGNIARNLLFDPAKSQVLVECVSEKSRKDGRCDRNVFNEFITNLSVICTAVSSKRNVNTEEIDHLCKEKSLLIVTHWPTFRFTPSMHQILANSAALIDENSTFNE